MAVPPEVSRAGNAPAWTREATGLPADLQALLDSLWGTLGLGLRLDGASADPRVTVSPALRRAAGPLVRMGLHRGWVQAVHFVPGDGAVDQLRR